MLWYTGPFGCTGAPFSGGGHGRRASMTCGLYPAGDPTMPSTNPTYLKHAIGVVPAFLLTLARSPPNPNTICVNDACGGDTPSGITRLANG